MPIYEYECSTWGETSAFFTKFIDSPVTHEGTLGGSDVAGQGNLSKGVD